MFRNPTRGEQFLYDQDQLRRKSQEKHHRESNKDWERRNEAFSRDQQKRDRERNARDARIQGDMDEREWRRRNEDHKKSVFYGELQAARAEGRAAIYASYLDVPDLPRPSKSAGFSFGWIDNIGSILMLLAIVAVVIGCILFMIWRALGGFITFIATWILIGYAALTVVWLIRRFALRPSTPEEIAAAKALNPVTVTRAGFKYVSRLRSDLNAKTGQRPGQDS